MSKFFIIPKTNDPLKADMKHVTDILETAVQNLPMYAILGKLNPERRDDFFEIVCTLEEIKDLIKNKYM